MLRNPFLVNPVDWKSMLTFLRLSLFFRFLISFFHFGLKAIHFTSIAAQSTVSDKVTNYVTHRIFNTNLYSFFRSNFIQKRSILASNYGVLSRLIRYALTFLGPPCKSFPYTRVFSRNVGEAESNKIDSRAADSRYLYSLADSLQWRTD